MLAVPIYSGSRLPAEVTQKLLSAEPAKGSLAQDEIKELLEDFLSRDDLNSLIEARVEERRQDVISERKAIRASLQRNATWLDQTEKISLGSWDVLAIKILWPGL